MRHYLLVVYALGLLFLVALPSHAAQVLQQPPQSQNNSLAEPAQAGVSVVPNTQTLNTQDPSVQNLNTQDPNAPTLAQLYSPTDSELSYANTELLAKNAELTHKVDDLTTQVNVLVQERSGQLFIYGAMTAAISMIAGFIIAKLTNRQRW